MQDLYSELETIEKDLAELEVRKMLSGELDTKNCYLSINSGAGGTEACDWALMLSACMSAGLNKRGWKVEDDRHVRR